MIRTVGYGSVVETGSTSNHRGGAMFNGARMVGVLAGPIILLLIGSLPGAAAQPLPMAEAGFTLRTGFCAAVCLIAGRMNWPCFQNCMKT